ncbi:TetR family transcriptional regulator [Pseudomonas sp. NPDC008258]|uniref:helix-turn-helix domain-containing protein n=1 Tax=Pseudomonas sp. NPDC008258 TaxID=3364418 RepID=UPI0036E0A5D7
MLEAARPCPSSLTQAATELMVEIGYTAMTMRKLALRVGILPGSLYHHVDCKQDCAARHHRTPQAGLGKRRPT